MQSRLPIPGAKRKNRLHRSKLQYLEGTNSIGLVIDTVSGGILCIVRGSRTAILNCRFYSTAPQLLDGMQMTSRTTASGRDAALFAAIIIGTAAVVAIFA